MEGSTFKYIQTTWTILDRSFIRVKGPNEKEIKKGYVGDLLDL